LYLDWFEQMRDMAPDVAEEYNWSDAVAIETVEAINSAHHWYDVPLSL